MNKFNCAYHHDDLNEETFLIKDEVIDLTKLVATKQQYKQFKIGQDFQAIVSKYLPDAIDEMDLMAQVHVSIAIIFNTFQEIKKNVLNVFKQLELGKELDANEIELDLIDSIELLDKTLENYRQKINTPKTDDLNVLLGFLKTKGLNVEKPSILSATELLLKPALDIPEVNNLNLVTIIENAKQIFLKMQNLFDWKIYRSSMRCLDCKFVVIEVLFEFIGIVSYYNEFLANYDKQILSDLESCLLLIDFF